MIFRIMLPNDAISIPLLILQAVIVVHQVEIDTPQPPELIDTKMIRQHCTTKQHCRTTKISSFLVISNVARHFLNVCTSGTLIALSQFILLVKICYLLTRIGKDIKDYKSHAIGSHHAE